MTVNLRGRVSPEPLAEVDGTEWFRICRCPAGALLAANLRARAAAGGCFRVCSSWHVLRRAGPGPLRHQFKVLQVRFRQVWRVGALGDSEEFKRNFKSNMKLMDDLRCASPAVPDRFFAKAQKKINKGHYDFSIDTKPTEASTATLSDNCCAPDLVFVSIKLVAHYCSS